MPLGGSTIAFIIITGGGRRLMLPGFLLSVSLRFRFRLSGARRGLGEPAALGSPQARNDFRELGLCCSFTSLIK